MIDLETRIAPNPSVIETTIHGESVMVHLDRGKYFTLNKVGTEIWERLKQGRSVGEVCCELAGKYDAPCEQIENEALELVSNMVARGIATAV